MKVTVINTRHIELTPENDADNALIEAWGNGTARLAGSTLKSGPPREFAVGVEFVPDTDDEEQHD